MKFPLRVEPVTDFATLTDAQRHRSHMMGRKGKPDSSNVMRTKLKFPHAASINEGFDVRQDHHILTMRLFQFMCERTVWLYNCEYLWSRHRVSAAKDGINDEDLLAVAVGPSNDRLQGLDRIFANASDELHYQHCLSDESWNAMRAYHPEAPADAIGTYGVYVLMCGFTNSVGAVLEDDVEGFRPEIAALIARGEGRGGPSAPPRPARAYPTRLQPVDPRDYNQAQITALKPLRGDKIADSRLMRSFIHFPAFVSSIASIIQRQKDSLLPARLIHLGGLRTAWLYGCETVWAQEREACLQLGVSEAEIFEVAVGPSSAKLSGADRLIVAAMDELHSGGWLTDKSWDAIVGYGEEAPLDVIGTHALYALMSTMANTLGVQLEEGAAGFSSDLPGLAK